MIVITYESGKRVAIPASLAALQRIIEDFNLIEEVFYVEED